MRPARQSQGSPRPAPAAGAENERRARARILLVAAHSLLRDLLVRALNAEEDLEVAACGGSPPEALEILASRPIDLVLLDVDSGGADAIVFPGRARREGYPGPVLILAAGLSDAESLELVRQGAPGIFFKREGLETLLKCIRQVLRGVAWLDRRTLEALLQNGSPAAPRESQLSEREREVLRAVLEGLTTKEIAARLKVAESTVKAAVRRLFEKTGVRNRTQLVRVALERYRPLP